jgi:HEPN domain-containing protein
MKDRADLARALITKGVHDLEIARIGLQHEAPLDTIAFHIQQCAEKVLKAVSYL